MAYTVKKQIRQGLPQVGVAPYGQIHLHSTGNRNSTAQNEADYHDRRPVNSGFFSHVVGNGIAIQTAPTNRGAYDVGGGWNSWGYAHLELIESHKTKAEFMKDYKIYVELARDLAKEAGIPLKLDSGNTGLITHEYATKHQPNNGSDHVDPYPYLAKWGITRAQFKKDMENGLEVEKPAKTKLTQGSSSKIDGLAYRVHVQSDSKYTGGTLGYVKEGETAGTTGKALRVEWLEVLYNKAGSPIEIDTHIQGKGWLGYRKGSQGTRGESRRMEAIKVRIADAKLAKTHDIEYRTHIQSSGWTKWSKNGEVSGTTGKAKRLEAVQIRLVKKK